MWQLLSLDRTHCLEFQQLIDFVLDSVGNASMELMVSLTAAWNAIDVVGISHADRLAVDEDPMEMLFEDRLSALLLELVVKRRPIADSTATFVAPPSDCFECKFSFVSSIRTFALSRKETNEMLTEHRSHGLIHNTLVTIFIYHFDRDLILQIQKKNSKNAVHNNDLTELPDVINMTAMMKITMSIECNN
ncbi:hypothetical protein Bhyg_11925 [Pseudolycoriella hygida]|uniref:Uncharacterized protein n=1 Tax=Pseudolycoriella hygida TaxID=35572 RepID=A0A9Q0MY27_9DIPT|nr:hypothetical protein Bhyg_11925 [Pseudolycoriella hygida]